VGAVTRCVRWGCLTLEWILLSTASHQVAESFNDSTFYEISLVFVSY